MELISEFPVSAHQSHTDEFQGLLTTVLWGFDPISDWARRNERSEAEMAIIMGCPLSVYREHIRTYNHFKMTSPLSGQQVLDFCYHAGIHPTDLIPASCDPRDAAATHIYEALVLLSRSKCLRDDLEYAALGLYREEMRYKHFAEEHPDIVEHHAAIKQFVALQEPEIVRDHAVQGDIIGVKNKPLRVALLPVFGHVSCATTGIAHPNFHGEDYFVYRHGQLVKSREEIQKLESKTALTRLDLGHLIADFYGPARIPLVLESLSSKMEKLRAMGSMNEHKIVQSLARSVAFIPAASDQESWLRHAPGFYVSQICDKFYRYATQMEEIAHQQSVLDTNLRAVGGFDRWLEQAQNEPINAYTMRLYCNQVLTPELAITLKRNAAASNRGMIQPRYNVTPE